MDEYKLFKDYKSKIKDDLKDLKVIYTDLDGTLFNDRGCLIKDDGGNYYFDAVRLLPAVAKKNWDMVLASGRNKSILKYNAQIIGLKNYISELGAEVIYNLGEKAYTTFNRQEMKYDLTYGGKDLIEIIKLFKSSFPGRIESRMDWSRYRTYNALFFGEIDLNRANKLLEEEGYEKLVMVDNGLSALEDLDLDIKRLHIYNLKLRGVNKARGVRFDKKIRNFSTDSCIALGDSREDLKMADEVKYFFLMRNALEHKEIILDEFKRHNNIYISDGDMNKGWAEVIGYLVD